MYWLKCWRDLRSSFFTFCTALLISHLFYRAVVQDWFGWVQGRALGGDATHWHQTAELTVKVVFLLMGLASFIFASEGLPRDFESKTMPYLFSRPRSRQYFLVASWTMGILLLIVLLTGGLLLDATLPPPITRPEVPFRWLRWIQTSFIFSIPAVVLYCLTFTLCILHRSARNGLRTTVGIVFGYSLLASYLDQAGIELPHLGTFVLKASLATGPAWFARFPHAEASSWLALAAGLTLLAYWSLRRYEA